MKKPDIISLVKMRHLGAKLLTDFYLAAGRNFATVSKTKTRTS
jgi:hypothetical protein